MTLRVRGNLALAPLAMPAMVALMALVAPAAAQQLAPTPDPDLPLWEVGLFGGQWLDKKLGTGGVLTWVGFAYGLAAAGRAIYRAMRKSTQEAEEAERREREAREKFNDDAKP